MYVILEIDGILRQYVKKKNGEIRFFDNMSDAENYILKHSYKGMSFRYRIEELLYCDTDSIKIKE